MTLLLVANPTAQSGSNAARITAARALMDKLGMEHVFIPTLPKGGTVHAVRDMLINGTFDTVVYMGGDGTFAEVAKGLLASHKPIKLGMLPTGTANDQGKSFGLDTDVEANVHVLKAGHTAKLDAVAIHAGAREDWWFDSAGWGISPRVLKLRNQDRKAIEAVPLLRHIYKDHVVYAGALFRTFLASYIDDDKFDVTVTADGQRVEWSGLTDLVVKNTRIYGGAWVFDRDSQPDDGLVEVVPFAGKRDWLSKAIVHLDGNPVTPEQLEKIGVTHSRGLRGKEITLEFAPRSAEVPLAAQIDGEEFVATERVELSVLRAALTLVVPASGPASG